MHHLKMISRLKDQIYSKQQTETEILILILFPKELKQTSPDSILRRSPMDGGLPLKEQAS